jgi:hypothetical protein
VIDGVGVELGFGVDVGVGRGVGVMVAVGVRVGVGAQGVFAIPLVGDWMQNNNEFIDMRDQLKYDSV